MKPGALSALLAMLPWMLLMIGGGVMITIGKRRPSANLGRIGFGISVIGFGLFLWRSFW
jgi:hypothetical protein